MPFYAVLDYKLPALSIPWQNSWVRIPHGAIDTVVWIGHVSRNQIRLKMDQIQSLFNGKKYGMDSMAKMMDSMAKNMGWIPWQK